MGKFQQRASRILSDAEQEFLGLLAEAAQARDYASIDWLSSVSSRLRGLLNGRSDDAAAASGRSAQEQPAAVQPQKTTDTFYSEGSKLLLRAISTRTGKQYEQRMSRGEVDSVASSIVKAARKDVVFKIDHLSVVSDSHNNGDKLPRYKPALVFRWLAANDLIIRHGHRGYSCRDTRTLRDEIERLWHELPAATA